VTDLVVLAKRTAQIAVGHENCAGPFPANQGILLAKMGAVARDHRLTSGPAHAQFTFQPIDLAMSGAETAVFENGQSALDSFLKNAVFVSFEVTRFHCLSLKFKPRNYYFTLRRYRGQIQLIHQSLQVVQTVQVVYHRGHKSEI
jgi:hypothetical protein